MAQTTCLASFGPVLVIPGLPVAYFVGRLHTLVSIYIKHERNCKKKLTYGPNDARRVVWAILNITAHLCRCCTRYFVVVVAVVAVVNRIACRKKLV